MQLTEFAEMTRDVIDTQGFSGFQPSACFPARREIRALAGVPDNVSHEAPAIDWASRIADGDEEFLVAFKHSDSEFKVVRVAGQAREEQVFQID